MRLIIKNMVCPRCINLVKQLLRNNSLEAISIRLGEVDLPATPAKKRLEKFANELKENGFELLDDKNMQLVESVKNLLIQKVHRGDVEEHFSVSKFISENIYKDYSAVSKLFSEVESITIEQFFILQKIEKIKEELVYNELSLGQIAFNLGYSSPQHLSNQFKKVTGMTASHFKQSGAIHRKSLDSVK